LFRLLFIGSVLAAINALLTFAGPLVIKKTIAFLNNKHSTYADQQRIHSFVWLWVFVFFIKVFLNQSAERHFIYAGLKSEQTLAMIVHQKIIKLSISYRLNMKRGSLYAFFTNDIKAVTSFINSASSLIAAPTIVIAVQILVFLEFH
jgi:ABC-type multidrug transport system fused ATPase/permease subunit